MNTNPEQHPTVKIIRLDKELQLPAYHSSEAAGFDFCSTEDRIIMPHEIAIVKTGLIIQAPEGHFLLIAARGGLSVKKGLKLANGVGIVDRDFCGPEDEIIIQLQNITDHEVSIVRGERLCQGLFIPVFHTAFEEVSTISHVSRGKHGSTGGYIS